MICLAKTNVIRRNNYGAVFILYVPALRTGSAGSGRTQVPFKTVKLPSPNSNLLLPLRFQTERTENRPFGAIRMHHCGVEMVPLRLLLVVLLASLHLICCVDIITTIAGTGTASYSGDDGPATSATINSPLGIAIDSSGNVFFNEFSNNILRKITVATGIISTYAGTGTASYSGDGGVASSAALNQPNGLCIDTSG